MTARRWRDAEAYVERAGRPDDPRSLLLAADAAFGAGDVERAGPLAAAAVTRAERAGAPAVLCEALDVAGRVARSAQPAGRAGRLPPRRAGRRRAPAGRRSRSTALIGLGTVELLERRDAPTPCPGPGSWPRRPACSARPAPPTWSCSTRSSCEHGPRAVEAPARVLLDRAARLHMPEVQAGSAFAVALARAASGDPAGTEAALARLPGVRGLAGRGTAGGRRPCPAPAAGARPRRARTRRSTRAWPGSWGTARPPPLHQFGLWALLRTAVDDRGAAARDVLRALPAALRAGQPRGAGYADAIAAGRGGRPRRGRRPCSPPATRTSPACPGCTGCSGCLVLEAAVADGWGDPVPLLRRDLAEHERAGDHQLARTCRDLLRRAGAPTRRGRGDSTRARPASARSASPAGRWTCSPWSPPG